MAPLSIYSLNVNGIRSAEKKGLTAWINGIQPDILCLQEIRTHQEHIPSNIIALQDYQKFYNFAHKPGYSGTAILTKKLPASIEYTIGIQECDEEGRVIIMHFDTFVLINCYVPNGRPDQSRVNLKIAFCISILEKSKQFIKEGKQVIICGDWNIAHTDIDLHAPKANRRKTGFLPEERACIDTYLRHDFFDVLRYFSPSSENQYTWWSPSHHAKERNAGWRFDYFLVHKDLLTTIEKIVHHTDILLSDHCPISITLQRSF